MSFDLYPEETIARLNTFTSAKIAEPGTFDNFFRGTRDLALQGFAKTGRAIDLVGAVGPIAQDKLFGTGTQAQDQYFKEHDEVFGSAVDYWTPKPNETGVAAEVVGGLLGTLPQIFASPGLAVASTQLSTAEDLVNKGVDSGKAQLAGAVNAVGLGLGIWVPILGKTLTQRVLLGGVGFNVVQGAATRGATGAILEGTAAEGDYKALDATQITLDVLLGAAFGGLAHVHPGMRAEGEAWQQRLSDWAQKLKPSQVDALLTLRQAEHLNVDSAPGKIVDPVETDNHVQRMRQAIDQLANDKPVDVSNLPEVKYEADPARDAANEARLKVLQDEAARVAKDDFIGPTPDYFAQKSTTETKLNDPIIREELTRMKSETGWAETGGRIIRDPTTNEVSGRTSWVANSEWWPDRPKGLKESQVHKAIDKAVSGEKLNAAEKRLIDYVVDVADQRIKSSDFIPTKEELTAHELSSSDELSVAMVARASKLDEAAVESLAVRFENDDAAFMRGIKGILDAKDKTVIGSSETGKQPQVDASAGTADPAAAAARAIPDTSGLDPLHAEALRFAADNPDLPISVGKNADGSDITTTPRQILDDAEAVVRQARDDARLFEIAAGCLLGAK